MKRTIFSRLALLPIMAAALALTSCIYDRPPGDNFYRTLWKADDGIPGLFDASGLTLEFLCNDGVSISLGDGPAVYGTYSPDGSVSVLNDLTVSLRPAADPEDSDAESAGAAYDDVASGTAVAKAIHVTFIEAHRLSEDSLLLIWQTAGYSNTSTTAMRRLSEYE